MSQTKTQLVTDVASGFNVAGVLTATAFKGAGQNLSGIITTGEGNQTIAGSLTIDGNITIGGTQTVINTEHLDVTDKRVGIASTAVPTSATQNLSGIEIYGPSNVLIQYEDQKGGVGINTGLSVSGFGTFSGAVSAASLSGPFDNLTVNTTASVGGDLSVAENILHIGDTDTKIQFGTDSIALNTAGTNRVLLTNDGKVGINTNNPQKALDVYDTSAAIIRASIPGKAVDLLTDSTGGTLRTIGSYPLILNTNQTERLRIGTSGQIGIAGANYGTDGQVLTSKGNSAAVQWATPASGGLTEWDQWSFVNNLSNLGQNMSTAQDLGSGSMGVIWQRINTSQNPGFEKIGVGMTHSSGVFTFPSVGKYEVSCHVQFRSWDQGRSGLRLSLFTSADGGSSWHGSDGTYYMEESTSNANYAFATLNVDGFINVDNTTNKKCKFVVKHNGENSAQIGIFGSASTVRTNCIFKKLN